MKRWWNGVVKGREKVGGWGWRKYEFNAVGYRYKVRTRVRGEEKQPGLKGN